MIVIPANTVFTVSERNFAVHGNGALQISVDGITFFDYKPISNVVVIADCPSGVYLRCTSELKLSCNASIVQRMVTFVVAAPRVTYDKSPATYRTSPEYTRGGSIDAGSLLADPCTPNWVNHGSSISFTAIPETGWSFSHWEDGSTTAARTVTVTADMKIIATFNKN